MTNSRPIRNTCLVRQSVRLSAISAAYPLQVVTGKHLRHARDHFALLIDCISSHPPYVLNYDTRSRNTPMESSRQAAHDALKDAIAQLENTVPHARFDAPLTMNAVTPYPQTLQSTFGREVGLKSYSNLRTDPFPTSSGSPRCMRSIIGPWQVSPQLSYLWNLPL